MDIITEYLNKINNIKIIESENKGDVIRFNRKFKNRGPYRTGSKIFAMVDKKGEYLGGLEYSESSISYVLNIYKRKKLNPDVFISFIFILPEYRSAGYGRKLLNIILNRYKNVALGTDEQTSDMALKLYKSLGFKIIKKESNKSCYWYKY